MGAKAARGSMDLGGLLGQGPKIGVGVGLPPADVSFMEGLIR